MTKIRYAQFAPRLVENGYDVTPLNGKKPILQGWQTHPPGALDFKKYASKNIGVLCGGEHNLVAVDIDLYDENAAQIVSNIAEDILGFAPVRIGQSPKSLLVYRCSAPIKKMKTGVYDIGGMDSAVEVLAEGQQFVASGIHPDARKKYIWPDDNLLEIEITNLTEVSGDAILKFINEANAALEKFGPLKAKSRPNKAANSYPAFNELDAPIEEITMAIAVIPNPDIHYDDWVHMAHAIKGAVGEVGWEIFDQWSQKSGKYDANETQRVWESIGQVTKIGAGTLFHNAREYGFDIGEWRLDQRGNTSLVQLGEICLERGTDIEISHHVKDDFESEFGPIVFTDGEFWKYDETHWAPIPENEMRLAVHRYDGAAYGEKGKVRLSKSKVDSILNELSAILFKRDFLSVRRRG